MPADRPDGTITNSIVSSTFSNSAVAMGKRARASVSGSSPDTVRAVVDAVASLRGQLSAAEAPDADTAAELRLVDQRLEDLEEEATSDEPNRNRLRRLLDQVTSGLQGVAGVAAAAEVLKAAVGKLLG